MWDQLTKLALEGFSALARHYETTSDAGSIMRLLYLEISENSKILEVCNLDGTMIGADAAMIAAPIVNSLSTLQTEAVFLYGSANRKLFKRLADETTQFEESGNTENPFKAKTLIGVLTYVYTQTHTLKKLAVLCGEAACHPVLKDIRWSVRFTNLSQAYRAALHRLSIYAEVEIARHTRRA